MSLQSYGHAQREIYYYASLLLEWCDGPHLHFCLVGLLQQSQDVCEGPLVPQGLTVEGAAMGQEGDAMQRRQDQTRPVVAD
jgi:hypothetical protein